MIKIRYRDPNELSPGLHAEAERRGRCTTVYLLSGLTKQERRAALRRLRLSARMGYCPSLPAPQLALALFKDRIRTGAWQTGAVVRLHPAGSTVPIMVLSGGAIAFLLLSTVSIHVLRPRTAEQTPAGSPPIAEASAIPFPGSSRGSAGAGPGQSGLGSVPVSAVSPVSAGSPLLNSPGLAGPGAGGTAGPGTGTSGGGVGSTGTGTSGTSSTSQTSTSQSGSNSNNGGTSQSSSSTGSSTSSSSGSGSSGSGTSSSGGGTSTSGGTSTGSTTPAQTTTTPASTSSSSSSGGGVCLDVGPLGICLSV